MTTAFSDTKHYPHGFRRSGDFSIKDADRIERFGTLFQQLLSGAKKAENDAEKDFFHQLTGKTAVTAPEVLAWNKYQAKISQSKQYFPLCSTPTEAEIGATKKGVSADDDDSAHIEADVDDDDVDDDDIEPEET